MVATGVMISYFVNCECSLLLGSAVQASDDIHHGSVGIGIHIFNSTKIWRIPFGLQLVPAGLMLLGLFTVKESPRYLASVGRTEEGLHNLAYLRRSSITDTEVLEEFAEIEAACEEERRAKEGLGWKEAFFGKGNFIRFVIAFTVFLLQQWSGQNSVGYYAPQIFASVRRSSPILLSRS
jgi:MFS family permease